MTINDIIVRLGLSLLVSMIIGYEREVNQSNAGIKTHTIVGVSATIIALIQAQIVQDSIALGLAHPDILGVVRSDPARLIAQVVSGIGFLGAGTIVVTKRNISGLTTAASIWSTAALGIALGMGFLEIALVGFSAIFLILQILKRIVRISTPHKVIIKHLGDDQSLEFILSTFKLLKLDVKILKYDIEFYHEQRIVSHLFEVDSKDDVFFTDLVAYLSENPMIVSIQSTNI